MGVIPDKPLLDTMQAAIAEKVPEFNHWDVSRSLMGFSAMGVEPREEVVGLLEERLVHVVDGMNLWTVTTTLRSLANMSACDRSGGAVRSLVGRAVNEADMLDSAATSNVMWSLAALGVHPGAEGASALMERVGQVISHKCTVQELTYMMWGAATIGGGGGNGKEGSVWRRAMEGRLEGIKDEVLSPRQVIFGSVEEF
jgi:hypothetical protein